MTTMPTPMSGEPVPQPAEESVPFDPAMYQPSKYATSGWRETRLDEVPSWLVLQAGVPLFVTECESFMRWYIEAHPGSVIEEVTGRVQEALARTAHA